MGLGEEAPKVGGKNCYYSRAELGRGCNEREGDLLGDIM